MTSLEFEVAVSNGINAPAPRKLSFVVRHRFSSARMSGIRNVQVLFATARVVVRLGVGWVVVDGSEHARDATTSTTVVWIRQSEASHVDITLKIHRKKLKIIYGFCGQYNYG